jgi:hypothetical protein
MSELSSYCRWEVRKPRPQMVWIGGASTWWMDGWMICDGMRGCWNSGSSKRAAPSTAARWVMSSWRHSSCYSFDKPIKRSVIQLPSYVWINIWCWIFIVILEAYLYLWLFYHYVWNYIPHSTRRLIKNHFQVYRLRTTYAKLSMHVQITFYTICIYAGSNLGVATPCSQCT